MTVTIFWSWIEAEGDPLLDEEFCLYAYAHPFRDWILYVGKADFGSVRQRLRGSHKERLFNDISDGYGVNGVRVLHGDLEISGAFRKTSALLADVESLLITRLQPFGNIQSTRTRISRPGLRIQCLGDWPYKRSRFVDL